MAQNTKPKRPLGKVLQNFYQVLKINTELADPLWRVGQAAHANAELPIIKVGIWNVFKGNGGDQFFRDYLRLVEQADVWLLQEVLGTQHGLRDYVPHAWEGIHAGSYERRDGLREGILTMSRYRLGEAMQVLALNREPLVRTPKGALRVTVSIAGQKLSMLNLHMPLFRSLRSFTKDLEHILGAVAGQPGALVVAGDFNTLNRQYKKRLDDVLGEQNLRHVNIPMDQRPILSQLDHVYTRGLKVESIKLIRKVHSSDHLPILCALLLDQSPV